MLSGADDMKYSPKKFIRIGSDRITGLQDF
jgi:hypothetical protein